MKFYEVGGAVRDYFMGVESKDVDFAVEADSFEQMEAALKDLGFKIFLSTPEFYTIRAKVAKDHPLWTRAKDADFVLCRKDGPTKDGRRPQFVEAGTILDDLARRDFTVNAIARDTEEDKVIDPYNGVFDIGVRRLKFVGTPIDRIREDGLRVLRGFRFMVTKGLYPDIDTHDALHSLDAVEMLSKVSIERVREELDKMFAYSNDAALQVVLSWSPLMKEAIFRDGLRLTPTLKR